MKIPWPQPFEDGYVWTFLEGFEEVAEAAGLDTDRGNLAALKTLLRGRVKAALDAARRGHRKMHWKEAYKEALAVESDTTADRQEAMRRFKTARMASGCDPTVFFASLQQPLDRAFPKLDGALRHRLLSDQFVEGVQPALGVQLRVAGATGQLSVEQLMHLARELADAPLATFQSQENREDSTVEDLKNKVGQLTEQLAAVKTESRRHARTSRCYRCGMPGHWMTQCRSTRPLVNNKILECSSFPGWVAIGALTQATIQAVVEIDGKRELCLIDTGAWGIPEADGRLNADSARQP
ncbi:gap-Pol polyprotein [Clonorchis sinensis]|uniref:Gap-Pol polyprotein n=1 Tax=Clonorchis sinensis TaxID=79923 RepID=G7YME8_CLOSI|nr:gap-Pol polyprotein [Clonorchis sinensis]